MIDHDATSMALISRVFVDGAAGGLTRDDVLDNITHYWLTNTGVSSARLYWENKARLLRPEGLADSPLRPAIVDIPVAVSVFPDELYTPPRSWAEEAYPKLIHYNKLDKGGHFAAWEQPQLFSPRCARGSVASLDVGLRRVHLPSLGGATGWLNSEPLGPAEVRALRQALTSGSHTRASAKQRRSSCLAP